MRLSRRTLLTLLPGWALAGSVGLRAGQGLEQFAMGGPPCAPDQKPTPAVGHDLNYRTGSPERSRLAARGTAGTPLVLSGTVSGITCGRVAGAKVEMWQPLPEGGFETRGAGLRGYQITNAQGEFRFETVMPGPAGRYAPYLGLHVEVKGKADFWTTLFFPDEPKNRLDPRYRRELLLTVRPEGAGRSAHFDVLLDI